MSGAKFDALIRAWAVQARPCSRLRSSSHVLGAADVVDRAVLRVVLDEGLAGGSLHGQEDGPREHLQPVAGVPAGLPGAEVEVGLLAGDQQELVVGEPAAFLEHRGQLGQAERAGVVGVAVAVELGDVDGLDAQPLEDADEVGDGQGVDPRRPSASSPRR